MDLGEAFTGIIAETVFTCLLKIPGAAIRWLFVGHKRSFNSVLNDQWVNTVTTLAIGGAVVAITMLIE